MELLLPQTVITDKTAKPDVFFRSYQFVRTTVCEFSGFCYIGRGGSAVEKLKSLSKREPVMAQGLDEAKAVLLKSLKQERTILPEFIICEAIFDLNSLRNFCQFLRSHPVFRTIPFLLEGSNLSKGDLSVYKVTIRPDEILSLQAGTEVEIHRKIAFLCKMKRRLNAGGAVKIDQKVARGLRQGFFYKRVFDILFGCLALVVLSFLLLLIAIAIKLESKGPVFYISKRAGRGYRIFNFYKFRTMHQDADQRIRELVHLNQYGPDGVGPVFMKFSNDPRITRVGRFLRNTSLDELPQLFNVVLGDMSLVGNRPLPLYEAKTLTTDEYAARFLAPAGITGLWQVKKRGNKDMSVEERISIDIDYASKCSFLTDFWIIASTPSALLQKENV